MVPSTLDKGSLKPFELWVYVENLPEMGGVEAVESVGITLVSVLENVIEF